MSQGRSKKNRQAVESVEIKGAGGLACMVFVAVLGAAFWAGAVFASQPWPY